LLIVRETLTQDLIERLVVDILEVAESLMGTYLRESLSFSCFLLTFLSIEAPDNILAATRQQPINQPDRDHGRPDKSNFGGQSGNGHGHGHKKKHAGFSRQC